MSFRPVVAFAALTFASLSALPQAYADEKSLPPSQPPPVSAQAPNGEYVAPLQQQTQQVYVPQSVAMSGPRIIKDYEPGDPVPPGYHAETRARTGLIVGGAVTLGTLWLISALVGAAMNDVNEYSTRTTRGDFLFVPVAGPFLQLINTETSSGKTVLVIDGAGQAAGAAMLIVGLTSPRTLLVRNDLAEVRIAPVNVGERGTGLGLVGRF